MSNKKEAIKTLESIVIAILIALFLRAFIVQAFDIPSGSMEPTLLPGDYILVNKFLYGIRIPFTNIRLFTYKSPQRGDIVVFIYPFDRSKDFIKRVIGLQGEKVQILDGKILIDDKQIPDPWGSFEKKEPSAMIRAVENFGPVVVPRNCVFVMGDNRNNSDDSRFWGFLPFDDLLGKAFIIYFSWNRKAESLPDKVRWSRIGQLLR